jgi:G-protein signaling modulator 2
LAELLKDRVVEAQACYSLGNTYTLLRDYKSAIEYHLRHLKIAQELRDRIGEGRAYWSLGNALTAIGDHHEALNYAQKHLEISKEIGDITGQTTAQMSISDLRKLLETDLNCGLNEKKDNFVRPKRLSMDRMELVNMTPQQRKHSLPTVDEVSLNSSTDLTNQRDEQMGATSSQIISKSHEDFLDLVSKFQSKRMDDQRCALDSIENKENRKPERTAGQRITTNNLNSLQNHGFGNPSLNSNNNANNNNNNPIRNHIGNAGSSSSQESQNSDHFHDDLFDLIAGMQERRMNDQRASLPPIRQNSATNGPESLPGQRNRVNTYAQPNRNLNNNNNNNEINQINDMPRMRHINNLNRRIGPSRQMSLGANVLPDDDFFEMLMRCQASRLEDQRSLMPATSSSERSSSLSTLERPQSVVSTQSNSPVFNLFYFCYQFLSIDLTEFV